MALGRCLLLLGLGPGSQWMNRLAASRILAAGRGRNHFRRQVFAEETGIEQQIILIDVAGLAVEMRRDKLGPAAVAQADFFRGLFFR